MSEHKPFLKFRTYNVTSPSGDEHQASLVEDREDGTCRFLGAIQHQSKIDVENLKILCGSCDGCDFETPDNWKVGSPEECNTCIRNPVNRHDNYMSK